MHHSIDRWIVFDMVSKKIITRNPVIFSNASKIKAERILKKKRALDEVRIVRSVESAHWVKRKPNLEFIK